MRMDRRMQASLATAIAKRALTARGKSGCARFQSRGPRVTEIAIDVARTSQAIRLRCQTADRTGALSKFPLSVPLVLDLDGTLIAGDLLYKSFFSILRRNPLIVFSCAK